MPRSEQARQGRATWLYPRFDYATGFVICSWVGLFMLWPQMPQINHELVPVERGSVSAFEGDLSAIQLYNRPNLIAFPSVVSFSATGVGDALPDHVEQAHQRPLRVFPRAQTVELDRASGFVALAAEAVREVSEASVPTLRPVWESEGQKASSPVVTEVSATLGKAQPVWSDQDRVELFSGNRAWEVELSLTMTEDAQVEAVFVETSSGDAATDRAVLMTVSRPGLWRNASAGYGRVLISFSPSVRSGGDHED